MKIQSFSIRIPRLLCTVITGVLLAGSTYAKTDGGIQWRQDAPVLLESQRDRPLLLRFTAAWCGPCRVMNANVWPDAKVAQMVNEHFIPVELDIDRPEIQAIARKFRIVAVPTLVLLDRDGEEIDRANFMSTGQVVQFLERAIAR